jgi:hypothetical protein
MLSNFVSTKSSPVKALIFPMGVNHERRPKQKRSYNWQLSDHDIPNGGMVTDVPNHLTPMANKYMSRVNTKRKKFEFWEEVATGNKNYMWNKEAKS